MSKRITIIAAALCSVAAALPASASAGTVTATNPYQWANAESDVPGQAVAYRDSSSTGFHLGLDLSANCVDLSCTALAPATAGGGTNVGASFKVRRKRPATVTATFEVTALSGTGYATLEITTDLAGSCAQQVPSAPGTYSVTCELTQLSGSSLAVNAAMYGYVHDGVQDGLASTLHARAVVRSISVTT